MEEVVAEEVALHQGQDQGLTQDPDPHHLNVIQGQEATPAHLLSRDLHTPGPTRGPDLDPLWRRGLAPHEDTKSHQAFKFCPCFSLVFNLFTHCNMQCKKAFVSQQSWKSV